ncbi:MFS transporter [Paenibacillus thiaminolyticus]|uniref:MFS transporter n=1 Tax=Paenibacillus thiaminolyticus TaxID=49283 RepID=A0AAP9J1P6_PANTH|nr:MFS transporter [Paenibacillus thiaminolyticus]MCY9536541.1 MFS transporter [Paenibacillus thiaminolyticus]MCY9601558.1 MFS transporter [Paenibacillus thiaminolyticus]MCY9608982.1 MFS transporter [Paenibacillus thiaminolyticus]MCY9612183.1 MFS transporter [Paenibacillus thiaminolyticus]MCY9619618.1 MFS transporter [Paenibacillus thiaminolyticus]
MEETLEKPFKSAPKAGMPYYWKVILVFTLGWVFMYADRTILNPVMPILAQEFGINNAQLGLINSVFFLAYAILQIPAGTLGDRLGRKNVLVPGYILFGLATAFTGIASTFFMLLLARIITGVGEGTYYGPQYALSSEAIPEKVRTIGTAVINSGQAIGISLGYITASTLTLEKGLNWRIPFYIMAIPTIITALLIWFVIKEKPRKFNVEARGADTNKGETRKTSMFSLFKNRNLSLTFIMVFCSLYGFFAILTWLPQYLQTERGYQGSDVGFISSLVPWASIPGALFFGYLSDKFGRRKPLVYILVPIAALSIYLVVYTQSDAAMMFALIVYGLTGKLALDPVLVAFVADNAPKEAYSTAFGLYNFIGMSSSILAPYITGYLVDTTGSMRSGFFLAMVLLFIGLAAMIFTKEKPRTRTA